MANKLPDVVPKQVTPRYYGVNTEVQFKQNPGVGYIVIEVVKEREHALRAIDGSGLAIGLSHELELFCDIEREAFCARYFRALGVSAELGAPREDALKLWAEGARFPDNLADAEPPLSNAELVMMLCDVVRKLADWQGFRFATGEDKAIITHYHDKHPRIYPIVRTAIAIMELTRGAEMQDAIDDVYPLEQDDI